MFDIDILMPISAVIAVGVSVYAFRDNRKLARETRDFTRRMELETLNFTRKMEHEIAAQTLIHDQYELCRQLDLLRVEHPDVSHMLPLPAPGSDDEWQDYEQLRRHVRTIVANGGPVTEAMRSRMYLKEHAIALDVCNIYEQTLLQRQLAKDAGDQNRFKVLDDLTIYYESKMLRSPRMRFHWDSGASHMMEDRTRQRYDEQVRKPYPNEKPDHRLPFDD
jgi:hypothetical protein